MGNIHNIKQTTSDHRATIGMIMSDEISYASRPSVTTLTMLDVITLLTLK